MSNRKCSSTVNHPKDASPIWWFGFEFWISQTIIFIQFEVSHRASFHILVYWISKKFRWFFKRKVLKILLYFKALLSNRMRHYRDMNALSFLDSIKVGRVSQMVISSEFRMGQYIDDHWEDVPHFTC